MARAISILKAAIPTLLLALVAPSTAGLRADTPIQSVPEHTVLVGPATADANPAIETLPKSQFAWNFATLPDGTQEISGPNGVIWQGRLKTGMEPINPSSSPFYNPTYPLYLSPNALGQKHYYEIVPPSGKSTPQLPNLAPILPPGHSQPKGILPKPKP